MKLPTWGMRCRFLRRAFIGRSCNQNHEFCIRGRWGDGETKLESVLGHKQMNKCTYIYLFGCLSYINDVFCAYTPYFMIYVLIYNIVCDLYTMVDIFLTSFTTLMKFMIFIVILYFIVKWIQFY